MIRNDPKLGQGPTLEGWCLYQTCPTGTRKGQKRPFLVPWDKSYTHAGGLSLSRDKFYTHDGACPSSTCPNLSHKVGLQGREVLVNINRPPDPIHQLCSAQKWTNRTLNATNKSIVHFLLLPSNQSSFTEITEYVYFSLMMMIAFITFKSSLVPLFEGL